MKMNTVSPVRTVERLIESLNQADIETAVSLYEDDAVFFPEPGTEVKGREAIREALAELVALSPHLSAIRFLMTQTETTALYCSHWKMRVTTPDGSVIILDGSSSDVLRMQSDGRWLIAIDNPFGTEIIEAGR